MYRRLGYGYYSEGFYNEVARAAMANEGRIDNIQNEMMRICANDLSSMQPKYIHVWVAILFDVFSSTGMDLRLAKYLNMCHDGGEFEYLSVDSTFKPTFPLVGQAPSNCSNKIKQKQAVPYNEQLHTVHIVRGSCGSALLAHPMMSESISADGPLYASTFTETQRDSVRFFCADKVGHLLTKMTRAVFPNIRGCALDPLHLAFATETIQKPNELNWNIRRIMSKFDAPVIGDACSGEMYQGGVANMTAKGKNARDRVLAPRQSITSAKRKLRNVDANVGFSSRREFCSSLSDAVAAFPHLAKNLTWSKKPVKRHLYAACTASTTEWYLNNTRIRRETRRRNY